MNKTINNRNRVDIIVAKIEIYFNMSDFIETFFIFIFLKENSFIFFFMFFIKNKSLIEVIKSKLI